MLMPVAAADPEQLHLTLLNGFSLSSGDGHVVLQPSGNRLLAFLAMQRQPVLRSFVAGTLWPDSDDQRATANLRTTLWRLPRRELVFSTNNSLALDPRVSVDARRVISQARRLVDGNVESWDPNDLDLMSGELLPDWCDDWLMIERERFRQLRIHALERVGDQLMTAGRFDRAIDIGLAAVAAEPLRESGHRLVIRAHLAEGNRGDALRQYRTFSKLLRDELGIGPSDLMDGLIGPLRSAGSRSS